MKHLSGKVIGRYLTLHNDHRGNTGKCSDRPRR
jgi:hypothetical protein